MSFNEGNMEQFIDSYGSDLIEYANETGETSEIEMEDHVLNMSQQAGLTLSAEEITEAVDILSNELWLN